MNLSKLGKGLLFSRDPGAANNIAVISQYLHQNGINILLCGKDAAIEVYNKFKLPCAEINSLTDIKKILLREKPDWVLTGTSADDESDILFWKFAKELQITSFAILDQWINYLVRFSHYNVEDLKNRTDIPIEHMPDFILTMDNYSKKEMIEVKFPAEKIKVCGHPWLSQFSTKTINKRQASLNPIYIYFASEPIQETYKELKENSYWGYDQESVLIELADVLDKVAKKTPININLILKLHPKNNQILMSNIVDKLNSQFQKININISKQSGIDEIINQKGIVIGLSSMLLLETTISNIPTISFQPGLKREDPFILSRMGLKKTVTTQVELEKEIITLLECNLEQESIQFEFLENATERTIQEIIKSKNL